MSPQEACIETLQVKNLLCCYIQVFKKVVSSPVEYSSQTSHCEYSMKKIVSTSYMATARIKSIVGLLQLVYIHTVLQQYNSLAQSTTCLYTRNASFRLILHFKFIQKALCIDVSNTG